MNGSKWLHIAASMERDAGISSMFKLTLFAEGFKDPKDE